MGRHTAEVFGLENWTSEKPTYITEGPIDSLFLPNAIAACGSGFDGCRAGLEDQDIMKASHKRIYIWDNEPRNKDIVSSHEHRYAS
jgi:hypothetical protein